MDSLYRNKVLVIKKKKKSSEIDKTHYGILSVFGRNNIHSHYINCASQPFFFQKKYFCVYFFKGDDKCYKIMQNLGCSFHTILNVL